MLATLQMITTQKQEYTSLCLEILSHILQKSIKRAGSADEATQPATVAAGETVTTATATAITNSQAKHTIDELALIIQHGTTILLQDGQIEDLQLYNYILYACEYIEQSTSTIYLPETVIPYVVQHMNMETINICSIIIQK